MDIYNSLSLHSQIPVQEPFHFLVLPQNECGMSTVKIKEELFIYLL